MIAAILLLMVVLLSTVPALQFSGNAFTSDVLRFVCLGLLAFCLGMYFKRTAVKMLLFCALAVFAALAVVEGYLAQQAHKPTKPEYDYNYEYQTSSGAQTEDIGVTEDGMVYDISQARALFEENGREPLPDAVTAPDMNTYEEKLGYRLRSDTSEVLGIKMDGDKMVYMSAYHLDSGWRVTPQNPGANKAVVFMGDSFTFGLGLEDEQTYPYKVGQALGEEYQVFNYGVGGWGTHHMLAMIENGWLDALYEQYDEVHVFYMAIDHHMDRIAGEVTWDEDGPCYQLQDDGAVECLGPFKDTRDQQRNTSLIFSKLDDVNYKQNLMMAIIRQADRLLQEQYGGKLSVIRALDACEFLTALQDEGIDVLHQRVSPMEDYLIPDDGHPNEKYNDAMRDMLVPYITSDVAAVMPQQHE